MASMRCRASASFATMTVFASALLIFWAVSPDIGFMSTAGARGKQGMPVQASLRGRQASLNTVADGALPAADMWGSRILAGVAAFAMAIVISLGGSSPAKAFFGTGNSGEIIGEIEASGLVFKDLINVERITDPKVTGVTLYQTDFSQSSFDKLKSGNLLQADPSASGLACSVDGKVLAKPDISKDKKGEDIFSESKAFLGKTLKVKRIFDEKSKNVIYVVYTERLNKDDDPNGSRFKSQACAVHLDGFQ